jgi:hypothetical protein
VHTGFSRSAAAAAALAAGDGLACYRETEAPEDLDIAGSAGLVAAQAQLLMHRPKRALRSLLNVARTAALMKRRAPADYLRQLGVVAFQMEDDRRARALFAQAARALAETEPHCRPIDVEFTAARYTLCESRPSWDAAAELLTRVVAAFPGESLQRSMMVHWTVAAGFSTDSAALRRASETLLDDERQTASRYAHQATVNRLLGVTPNLQLDIWLRRQWLRWVMYANAFAAR